MNEGSAHNLTDKGTYTEMKTQGRTEKHTFASFTFEHDKHYFHTNDFICCAILLSVWLQRIIRSWPHQLKNYSGQKKGSNKKGIVFPLMGSAWKGETVHSPAYSKTVYECLESFYLSINSGSLRSGNCCWNVKSKQIYLPGSLLFLNSKVTQIIVSSMIVRMNTRRTRTTQATFVKFIQPTPTNAIVVDMLAALGAKHLHHHTVEVEALHQHPCEGAQEEEVKQDSHDLTGQLGPGRTSGMYQLNLIQNFL